MTISGTTSWDGWLRMATLIIQGKKYRVTDDKVAEYERLVDELKAEIAKIPESVHEPTVLDLRDDEPYLRLTNEYLGKILSMLEE